MRNQVSNGSFELPSAKYQTVPSGLGTSSESSSPGAGLKYTSMGGVWGGELSSTHRKVTSTQSATPICRSSQYVPSARSIDAGKLTHRPYWSRPPLYPSRQAASA